MYVYKCPECRSPDLVGYVSGTFIGQIDCDGNIEGIQTDGDHIEFDCQSCGKFFIAEEEK